MNRKEITDFGVEVKMYCITARTTCKDLAKEAGITPVALCNVMYGRRDGRYVIPAVRRVMETDQLEMQQN